jgi:hypothetical protein
MMIVHHKIAVNTDVATQVIQLYHHLDNKRGGQYGTWHSRRLDHNPYAWFDPVYNQVKLTFMDLQIDQWWFNCGAPGDENRWHSHSPYPWAAVLYIQMPEHAGAIEFKRQAEFQMWDPQVGDLIVFPGNLAHRVHKNLSDQFRISAAFNLKPRK